MVLFRPMINIKNRILIKMATLWNKGYVLNQKIKEYTVGNDYLLDKKLVKFDCLASKAHARMLHQIGLISNKDLKKILFCLDEIIMLAGKGKFQITRSDEDCHTAIENYLTKKLGDTGKKIHTARSRNDQVLAAVRLWLLDASRQKRQ